MHPVVVTLGACFAALCPLLHFAVVSSLCVCVISFSCFYNQEKKSNNIFFK